MNGARGAGAETGTSLLDCAGLPRWGGLLPAAVTSRLTVIYLWRNPVEALMSRMWTTCAAHSGRSQATVGTERASSESVDPSMCGSSAHCAHAAWNATEAECGNLFSLSPETWALRPRSGAGAGAPRGAGDSFGLMRSHDAWVRPAERERMARQYNVLSVRYDRMWQSSGRSSGADEFNRSNVGAVSPHLLQALGLPANATRLFPSRHERMEHRRLSRAAMSAFSNIYGAWWRDVISAFDAEGASNGTCCAWIKGGANAQVQAHSGRSCPGHATSACPS